MVPTSMSCEPVSQTAVARKGALCEGRHLTLVQVLPWGVHNIHLPTNYQNQRVHQCVTISALQEGFTRTVGTPAGAPAPRSVWNRRSSCSWSVYTGRAESPQAGGPVAQSPEIPVSRHISAHCSTPVGGAVGCMHGKIMCSSLCVAVL